MTGVDAVLLTCFAGAGFILVWLSGVLICDFKHEHDAAKWQQTRDDYQNRINSVREGRARPKEDHELRGGPFA